MSTATATAMHTIKLVVIGASGVGKTSLRGQYISGRFSSGYKATIGADFIAKTIPHPTKPEQNITLQIWDTAGQERFSSLSTAFFRGADAVILVFDVHQAETLDTLKKWWADFCAGVPLAEEDLPEHPCFVVGNKVDLIGEDRADERIPSDVVHRFLAELIPSQDPPSPVASIIPPPPHPMRAHRSPSIDIKPRIFPIDSVKQNSPDQPHSQSKSVNKFNSVSSTNTNNSIYFTPSSSVFTDAFHTARSSPEVSSTPVIRPAPALWQRRPTTISTSSTSSGSATTITPSLFAREQRIIANGVNNSNETASTTPEDNILDPLGSDGSSTPEPPLSPERGPSLHFTSAKTGEGVKELFEHIAARVVRKMEYEEYYEARQMHYREASGAETIRLGTGNRTQLKTVKKMMTGCCT